jgi:hypothetical protein
MRVITLPALDNRQVSLAAYVVAVKLAKANPDRTFTHGLTTWWPTLGSEIVQQFLAGVHDRINMRGGFEQYKGYDPRNDRRVLQRIARIRGGLR